MWADLVNKSLLELDQGEDPTLPVMEAKIHANWFSEVLLIIYSVW